MLLYWPYLQTMNVGTCKIRLRLPGNGTLKGKRQAARSITSRIRNKFNVSIAEVDENDAHQTLVLGVTCVSNDSRHANQVLSNVVDYVHDIRGDAELLDYEVDIISGV